MWWSEAEHSKQEKERMPRPWGRDKLGKFHSLTDWSVVTGGESRTRQGHQGTETLAWQGLVKSQGKVALIQHVVKSHWMVRFMILKCVRAREKSVARVIVAYFKRYCFRDKARRTSRWIEGWRGWGGGNEGKGRIKNESFIFGLSNWLDGSTTWWNREVWLRRSLGDEKAKIKSCLDIITLRFL